MVSTLDVAPVLQLLENEEFSQEELAAALNVSQAAVSNWTRGTRSPLPAYADRLERAIAAMDTEAVIVDAGLRRGPVRRPKNLWEPAFAPQGRFRLPLHLEWSGTAEQRWRHADDMPSLLMAYVIVMTEGRVSDMVRWIDPKILATHMDEVIWPRGYEPVWRAALEEWGLL